VIIYVINASSYLVLTISLFLVIPLILQIYRVNNRILSLFGTIPPNEIEILG